MAKILDSGSRREFSSGAVRDIQDGKGRCDLLPLSVVCPMMEKQEHADVLYHLAEYMLTGHDEDLYHSLFLFSKLRGWSIPTMILEVSKHYEEGASKYGEHNWQKGIPLHCYIDSAVRHFLKYVDGREDEPHDRAFIWNILGALWTKANLPSMVDLVFPDRPIPEDSTDSNVTDSQDIYDARDAKVSDNDNITVSKSNLADLLENISQLCQS